MADVRQAIEHFRLDHDRYPMALDELVRCRQSYLKMSPEDPWGRPFLYRTPGPEGEPFQLRCYGADGIPGGIGEDKDLIEPNDPSPRSFGR